ncbi:MAG: ArsA family ATPase [Planctomycetota bacterium]
MTDLLEKRLVVISGKGGVGKTVISSALGLIASARGMNVLLVKMDDQGRTQQLFELDHPVEDRVTPLRDSISAINLDPITVVSDYFLKQLRVRTLVKHIVGSRLFQNWFRVSPAIKEMISLGKVWDLVEERSWWRSQPKWDLVIFDAPATGHGLGLLALPEQASKLLMGPLRTNALGVQAMLENPKTTGLIIVTIPEEMPVNEAVHFYESAKADLRVPLEAVVLNAVAPDRLGELEELEPVLAAPAARVALGALVGAEAAPELTSTALGVAAEYGASRARLAARYREELRTRIALPLIEVPYVFAESFGYGQLEQVARVLEESLVGAGLIGAPK